MKMAYDGQADGWYATIREGEHARTVEVEEGATMVDLDADGRLLGIEVLSPHRLWPLAEILRHWEVDPADAAMLMANYPCTTSIQVA